MADVSKLARARMAKAAVAGPHPEADLLNAFAERSATPAEREQVLAHLATCADCREVVSLAAPEAVPLEQPILVPRRSRWLPAGVFRWGAMAAAVAVVAVVVIVESPKYQQPNPALEVAKTARKQASDAGFAANEQDKPKANSVASLQAEPKAAPAQTAGLKAEAGPAKKDVSPTAAMDKLAEVAPPPAPPTEAARAKQAGQPDLAKAQPAGSGGLVRPAPVLNASNVTVSDQAASQSVGTAGSIEAAKSAPAAAKAPARAEERAAYDTFTYGNAPAAGAGAGVAINGQRTRDVHVRGVAYKWTVTSDGRVQRSSDGRTWFFVPVDPKARLRALASDGDEVWVGGDRGALYHSTDSGDSWNKVPVDRITGDIIRLVVNGDTIQISTSSGQTISMSHEAMGDTPAKPASPR